MDLRVLRNPGELAALVPAWTELLGRVASPEITMTPGWLVAWWRHFGDRRELCAVAMEEGGRLVGFAPLLRRVAIVRRALPVRRIELLATGEDEADEICSDYV